MGKVLAIVNRAISTYLINKAGFKVSEAHTGAVTLIQRYRDGTTHVIFEPVDFIAKLAALVPRPRVN